MKKSRREFLRSGKMRLVIDTNKIIACLLKDGKVRRLIFLPILELYSPRYALDELESKKEKLYKKSPKDLVNFVLKEAKTIIKFDIAKDEDILNTAKEIAKQFDYKDYPFIALALKLNVPVWTNDKAMIIYGLKTGKYLALDTQAVEHLIKGKSLEKIRDDLKRRYL